MNWDQISSVLRNILMFAGGFLVSKGWLDAEQLGTIVGAVIGMGGVAWSIWANTQTSIISAAANTNAVDTIKLNPTAPDAKAIAAATPTNVTL